MTLLKQAMAVLGTVLTITVLVALISPKTAHAIAATLVQIEPGTTTHMGQNESQLVLLQCTASLNGSCYSINSNASYIPTPYKVPAGYTLILTDWEYFAVAGGSAGVAEFDNLYVTNSVGGIDVMLGSEAVTASGGYLYKHERYETGVRVASELGLGDTLALYNGGYAFMQGYLVPN
ncbi:MAG TPA: hypothetical protein VMD97_09775 [Candidatus Aquilonibacter sp.]|nr:hypothetical protein [Candidatus Aquilonibacter sp.]